MREFAQTALKCSFSRARFTGVIGSDVSFFRGLAQKETRSAPVYKESLINTQIAQVLDASYARTATLGTPWARTARSGPARSATATTTSTPTPSATATARRESASGASTTRMASTASVASPDSSATPSPSSSRATRPAASPARGVIQ